MEFLLVNDENTIIGEECDTCRNSYKPYDNSRLTHFLLILQVRLYQVHQVYQVH